MAREYAKWNSNDAYADIIFVDDYTVYGSGGNGWQTLRATLAKGEGSHYVEFQFTLAEIYVACGISPPGTALNYYLGSSTVANSWGWIDQAEAVRKNNGNIATGMVGSTNDYVSLAINFDIDKMWYARNGNWSWGTQAGDPVAGTGGINIASRTTDMYLAGSVSNYNSARLHLNAGQETFQYTVPTGFNAGWYIDTYSAFYNGYTLLSGNPVSRTVRLYDLDTGVLQDSTTSSGIDGAYSLETTISGAHYIVCLDDTANYNHLVNKGIVTSETFG